MRILYLSSSGQLGGAERVLLDLGAALRRTHPDWSLHLASLEPGPFVAEAGAAGMITTVLPLSPSLAKLGEAGESPASLAWHLAGAVGPARRSLKALRRLTRDVAPTLIHSNGLKTHVLSAMANTPGTPLVWHVHDYLTSRPVTARLLRLLARRAQVALATSESVASDLERAFHGRVPVTAVLNGIDTDDLRPDGPSLDLDAACGLPPAPPGTVHVGLLATFARWKGHRVFLDAMSRVPSSVPVRGYVIGGPLYQTRGAQFDQRELMADVERLSLAGRVGFTGFKAERAAALRALDVVVHASTAPEPFGLVIAEAMSSGRAVITTAQGGAAELVQPEVDVVTVAPGDAAELAQAIVRLAADPSLRRRLGAVARETALQRFGRVRFAEDVASVYASVLRTALAA